MKAERGNGLRGQSAQSVNDGEVNLENGGESSHAAHKDGAQEATNASRRSAQGGGRNIDDRCGHNAGDQAEHNAQNQPLGTY